MRSRGRRPGRSRLSVSRVPTAAEYAFQMIQGSSADEAAKQIAARYRVSKGTALEDYNDFLERIHVLVSTPDLDPVSFLDFELVAPHSAKLIAPLRLDCALTYRLSFRQNGGAWTRRRSRPRRRAASCC